MYELEFKSNRPEQLGRGQLIPNFIKNIISVFSSLFQAIFVNRAAILIDKGLNNQYPSIEHQSFFDKSFQLSSVDPYTCCLCICYYKP